MANGNVKKIRINPLSRMPKEPRLVMAIRGGAGVGKSFFAGSMADAGIGRLCIFDTERKSRLLRGVGEKFDAVEVQHPDELPDFIDWALSGEGQAQNYGCFALDSWAAYFGAKHSETIMAVRDKVGDPLAQPSAEELASDQMILQGVLRRLCTESGKCVVIVDQIGARGKETKEDNEVGRVLPMTASGLEYFVDVMVECSLQERQGEIVRVFQVVKSNSSAFEVGFELTGQVGFGDFLAQLRADSAPFTAAAAVKYAEPVAEYLPAATPVEFDAPAMTIEDLLGKAAEYGFRQNEIVTAAKLYCNQPNIYKLTAEQIEDLDRRMTARMEKAQMPKAAELVKPGMKTNSLL
jgi:hypothetical protein